ncbi:hypothetical protein J7I93_17960 [Bacillus sp. ISL-47]|uniref:YppG family protein n=1 Tax=Bacillus sp. ISL-47 TaxID=2819130 RepID=UPI001BE97000|nr:YppG family protein [Bacillus sp. ISL-47]MBT2690057.1 hypothetical protein [Bacillus sp. ISL-47]MBT2707851.1 hypothetical protein [Pseudomonas sp. ISL-84]
MFGRKTNRASHFQPYGHWNQFSSSDPFYLGMNGQHYMRQQPMHDFQVSSGQWNPYYAPYGMTYQQPYPVQYPMQDAQPNYGPNPYPSQGYGSNYYPAPASQNTSIFQNPLESEEYYGTNSKQQQPVSPYPYMNPYPKQSFIPKQPSGVQTIMNSFKAQDGSLDLNKMVDTAGQMMNAVTQVSSMVKGLGGIFKV